MSTADVHALVEHLFRRSAARMTATLTGVLGAGRLDLVEDVVQEALWSALRTWPFRGVPENPEAWLVRVARNHALDRLRRERTERPATTVVGETEAAELDAWADRLAGAAGRTDRSSDAEREPDEIADDRLRLLFACAHPRLPREARVPLVLKAVCGFGTGEIARAFLTSEATIAQRIVRAKRRLRSEAIELEVPAEAELPARLDTVLEVLYLVYNEGSWAAEGVALVRRDLVAEALRLATLLALRPTTATPAVHALLALMCFGAARLPTRMDAEGHLLLLAEQDRSRWDRALVARGFAHLERAGRGAELSLVHLEAGIAACHAAAPSFAETDWRAILRWYDLRQAARPSPVVALNRAVALAMVAGPAAGLAAVDALSSEPALARYALRHATRAELLRRLGELAECERELRRALALVGTEPERRFLERRLAELG